MSPPAPSASPAAARGRHLLSAGGLWGAAATDTRERALPRSPGSDGEGQVEVSLNQGCGGRGPWDPRALPPDCGSASHRDKASIHLTTAWRSMPRETRTGTSAAASSVLETPDAALTSRIETGQRNGMLWGWGVLSQQNVTSGTLSELPLHENGPEAHSLVGPEQHPTLCLWAHVYVHTHLHTHTHV